MHLDLGSTDEPAKRTVKYKLMTRLYLLVRAINHRINCFANQNEGLLSLRLHQSPVGSVSSQVSLKLGLCEVTTLLS